MGNWFTSTHKDIPDCTADKPIYRANIEKRRVYLDPRENTEFVRSRMSKDIDVVAVFDDARDCNLQHAKTRGTCDEMIDPREDTEFVRSRIFNFTE